MSTFAEIKALARKNLDDLGVTFYSNDDIVDSCQDAYNDIVAASKCITKKTTIQWEQDLVYYDLLSLGVSDYLGTIAIHNNNNRKFLDDDLTLIDIDRCYYRWELAKGTPSSWMPVNDKFIAINPVYSLASGNFDLYYWAKAPTVVDSATPLISSDMQCLLEYYMMADLVEQAEEYTKANVIWEEYFERLELYRERCENLARRDLLLVI